MSDAETIAVECPGCGARLRTKAANAGRRMPCPKCRADIGVPGTPPASAARGADRAPGGGAIGASAKGPWWRPRETWTAVDRFWHRLGVTLVIFGALAHVLPLFGLQFRKLAGLGKAAPTAGTGIAVLGVFLVAYVWMLKGKLFRVLVGAAAAVIVGFAALVVIGYFASHRGRSFPTPPQLPGPPAGSAPWTQGTPGGPGAYGPPGASSGWTPPGARERPVMDYDGFVERFGAERIARITFVGAEGVDIGKVINERILSWEAMTRPGAWFVRTRGVNKEMTAAPVDDFEAFAGRLDVGSISGTNAGERRVTIQVDTSKVNEKK